MKAKKTKKEPQEKHKIYLTYEQYETGGGVAKGEDEDYAYASRNPSHIHWTPTGIFTERGDWQETIEVDFDPQKHIDEEIYLLVVRYTDGDTFGYTTGHWTVEYATLNKEKAERDRKAIQEDYEAYKAKAWDQWSSQKSKYKQKYKSPSGYCSWLGYFASLDSVEVMASKLNKGTCPAVKYF